MTKLKWEVDFEEKFLVEGQLKQCDLCGHDHTESGNNEGYGDKLKDFIRKVQSDLLNQIKLEKRPNASPNDDAVGSEQRNFGYNLAIDDLETQKELIRKNL